MARCYLAELRAVQPVGPYFLCGWSFGGTVVFEMAQQLRAVGQEVALLAIIDAEAHPSVLRKVIRKPDFWLRLLPHSLRGLASWPQSRLRSDSGERQALLRSKARLVMSQLLETMWDMGLDPPGLLMDLGTRERFVPGWYSPVTDAHRKAFRDYIAAVYPGRMTLLKGSTRFRLWCGDPTGGWDTIVSGGVQVRQIPGDHDELFQEPHVKVVAAELRACLDDALARAGCRGQSPAPRW